MRLDNRLVKGAQEFAKKIAFRYTPFGAPHYPYPCMEPIELATLVMEMERLRGKPGAIFEIGVARGMTTRFLAEHIQASGSGDRLIAIDTFSSFVDSDVAFEIAHRGKNRIDIAAFAYNNFEAWKRNFRAFDFVEAIKADCAQVDYGSIGPVKLALLDVDLYLPVSRTLPPLYGALVPGGVILVDDVAGDKVYDGAHQAYHEFCAERGLAPTMVGNKCGLIRKHSRMPE